MRLFDGCQVDKSKTRSYQHIRPVMCILYMRAAGWMPQGVHSTYRSCPSFKIDAASILNLDCFKTNVSMKEVDAEAETALALICQLPPYSTAVNQPLDVGVMGPLKKLTGKWLADISAETDAETETTEDSVKNAAAVWPSKRGWWETC